MLHLLPIFWILRLFTLVVGAAVLAATYAGWFGGGDAVRDAEMLMRWSATIATVGIVVLFVAWRQIPLVQRWIFPYFRCRWSGVLDEGDASEHRAAGKAGLLRFFDPP